MVSVKRAVRRSVRRAVRRTMSFRRAVRRTVSVRRAVRRTVSIRKAVKSKKIAITYFSHMFASELVDEPGINASKHDIILIRQMHYHSELDDDV